MMITNQLQTTQNLPAQALSSYTKHAHQITGKRVWLACSGGRDSMALAYATFLLYQQGKLPFCPQLVHVNHGLQLVNDEWAELVKQWAQSLDIPCYVVQADFNQLNINGVNEQSARNARYHAIASLMNKGDVLMLAHHANDQTETVLMRLFTGAGVVGLSGIKEWATKKISVTAPFPVLSSVADTYSKTIHLWRPWLKATREQITDYANHHKLTFVDDPTNVAGENIRSWLRRDLLPTIKQTYPNAMSCVARTSQLLNDANNILTEVYQQDRTFTEIKESQLSPWDLVLDITKIKTLSMPRQSQLIHRWLQGDEPTPAGKHRVDEILTLIHRTDNNQQTELNWQGSNHSYSIRRYRNTLHRFRVDWLLLLQSNQVWQTQVAKNQLIAVKNLFTSSQLSDIEIRTITKDDKFAPSVKQKKQSGKKLMQLLSIPHWQRNCVQVVATKEQILCVFTPNQKWAIELN